MPSEDDTDDTPSACFADIGKSSGAAPHRWPPSVLQAARSAGSCDAPAHVLGSSARNPPRSGGFRKLGYTTLRACVAFFKNKKNKTIENWSVCQCTLCIVFSDQHNIHICNTYINIYIYNVAWLEEAGFFLGLRGP